MNVMLAQSAEEIAKAQQGFYGMATLAFMIALGAAVMLGVLSMTLVVAPSVTSRAAGALRARNLISFLAGLPFLGIFAICAAVGKHVPIVGVLGVLALSIFTLVGYAAASEDIGRRLFWACGKEGSRATHLAIGWLVFSFAACLPVIGWFIILPYVTLSGLGAILVGPARNDAPWPAAPQDRS